MSQPPTKQISAPTLTSPPPQTNPPSTSNQTKICVFCASSSGNSPAHLEAARSLARAMHKQNIHLVYGGGTRGLMGELARTLVSLSGKDAVEGVIPQSIVGLERPEDAATVKERAQYTHTGGGSKSLWTRLQRRLLPNPSNPQKGSKVAEHHPHLSTSTTGSTHGPITLTPTLSERKLHMARTIAAAGPGSGFIALPGGFGTMDEVMEMITLYQYGVHRRRVVFYSVEGYYEDVGRWVGKGVRAGFVRGEMWAGERDGVVAVREDAEGCLRWLGEGV